MDEKVEKVKVVWKSQAAINAYFERRKIDDEISDSKQSLYEKIVLRMQSAKMFQDLIGIAYQTAMSVESSALNNQAVIARMFVDGFEDD